jgi:hypothetical protein
MIIDRQLKYWSQYTEFEKLHRVHLVCVIREDDSVYPMAEVYRHAEALADVLGEKFEIHLGRLNEENKFVPLSVEFSGNHSA